MIESASKSMSDMLVLKTMEKQKYKAISFPERTDHSKNNLSRKNYTSKWDYTKAVSQWHFEKDKNDTEPYKVFMRVDGDWQKELTELSYEIDVSTLNYGFAGQDHDNIIENDFLKWGYKKEMVQYNRTYKMADVFVKIAQQLKLQDPDIRIHRQLPGMVAPVHIDTFCSHPQMDKHPEKDVSLLRRFLIQLTDWDWGHFWAFGNHTWSHWKAGEIVYFDSRDIPHCTANSGKEPRVTMVVTGWMTEETIALIEGDYSVAQI